jgi:hypothetical protein
MFAQALSRSPRQFRPMPMRSSRRRFAVALPLKYLDREALETKAEEDMQSIAQY